MDHKLKIILIFSIILLFLAIYFLLYKNQEGYYSSYSQKSEVDGVVTENGNSYINNLNNIYNPSGNSYVTGNSYIDGLNVNYLINGNSFVTNGNANVNYRYNKDNLDITYHADATSILNNSTNSSMLSDTIISFLYEINGLISLINFLASSNL